MDDIKTSYSTEDLELAYRSYDENKVLIAIRIFQLIDTEAIEDINEFRYKVHLAFTELLDFESDITGLEKFIADGFLEVWMLFLFYKNYGGWSFIQKNLTKKIMSSGKGILISHMAEKRFFSKDCNREEFFPTFKRELSESRIKRTMCPFHKIIYRDEFIDGVWNLIEGNIFPKLEDKFKRKISKYIPPNSPQSRTALFLLGLLKKYDYGADL